MNVEMFEELIKAIDSTDWISNSDNSTKATI